ncbi:MAG: RHS repeat-associated protein, partial [Saprospiraceae bacterium]
MARTEIGDWKVQGSDYAYTINGWLKAVNGNTLDRETDMGKDGAVASYKNGYSSIHSDVSQDVFGFSLGYYEGDYDAINTSAGNTFHNSLNNINTGGNYSENLGNGMFNGNIANLSTALMDENEVVLDQFAAFYNYDQLHRIKSMDAYIGDSYANATNNTAYATSYSYDGNGNLEYLTRNDHLGNAMDDFTYGYDGFTNPVTGELWNRLDSVSDAVNNTGSSDLGDVQHGQGAHNYTYSEIGELTSDEQEGIHNIEWRWKDSKIRRITRTNTSGDKVQIEYQYDAFGRRTLKLTKPVFNGNPSLPQDWTYTYYTYDAGGNVMAVYELDKKSGNSQFIFTEKEAHIYGASRLGLHKVDKILATYDVANDAATQFAPEPVRRTMGNKYYELSNHLGNVLSVVSDRKLYEFDIPSQEYLPTADVISYSDYYPFGMAMDNRTGSEGDYRYGFNGMEKDDEVKGAGNSYTTSFRQYDARLGRWLSIDPKMSAWESPYASMGNNPMFYRDPYGDTIVISIFNPTGDGTGKFDKDGNEIRSMVMIKAASNLVSEQVNDGVFILIGHGGPAHLRNGENNAVIYTPEQIFEILEAEKEWNIAKQENMKIELILGGCINAGNPSTFYGE